MRARMLVVLSACGVLLTAATSPAAADTTVQAQLTQQNDSGVRGSVTLTATDQGALRVQIRATGLLPGPHAQHIHGAVGGGHYHCASMQDDTDGDGWLTNEEATGEYGDVFLALTTRGDVSPASGLDLDRMPSADADGRLQYDRTIPAAQVPDELLDVLTDVHVVQHGIDANDNGKYDLQALGESSYAASLGADGVPEEATDPASCGMVVAAGPGQTPRGGVETGVDPPDRGATGPLTVLGVALLLLATAVHLRRRRTGLSDD